MVLRIRTAASQTLKFGDTVLQQQFLPLYRTYGHLIRARALRFLE